MISKCNLLLVSIVLVAILCCWATTSVDETRNISMMTDDKDDHVKRNGKYLNYLRLPDGQCHNCSTYKCTNHKSNMGGSEWCIMLFPDALAHCDTDPNCGGYTMTTAEWFHKKYDKNGQVAVHLAKSGQKPISCLLSEWSSYEKQNVIRDTPVTYGITTCGNNNQETCEKSQNFNYMFVSNSNAVESTSSYSCYNHLNKFENKDFKCILPMVDGIALCNSDDQCEGFMINTDENWQKKFLNNGMQTVQLFGKGVTYTPSGTWQAYKFWYLLFFSTQFKVVSINKYIIYEIGKYSFGNTYLRISAILVSS
ncbi:unnamed protein product [Rotaria sordida]|uniref:Uncharacterized protein n=1 Tax=Rotaria sordida TaxID=392033 RepID=A0A814YF99_9BILA|nr:unnamed protein product [Rotaria sordida]